MTVNFKEDVLQQLPTITVIYDNCSHDVRLMKGVGFSCLIEWGGRKILFDTGDGRAFFNNTKKQEIALNTISHVVFSNQHKDHTATFEKVLSQLKEKTPVLIPSTFSDSPLKKAQKKTDTFTQLDQNIYSLVLVRKVFCGFLSIQEQSLVLDTPKGLIIITGYAYPGILNIIKAAQDKLPRKILLVMGGFHLRYSFCFTITKVIKQFRKLDIEKVAPCHTTGDKAIEMFENAYDNDFIKIGTGSVLK